METQSDRAAREKVFDLIRDIQVTQLVTVDRSGKLRARPMVAQQHDAAGDLWFYTPAQSGKLDEIAHHPEVMLNYSDPRYQNYVSILGDAEVVHDRQKIRDLWSESMRVWFPKGPDDPDIALLRISVREADYWDSPSSTFVHAYGYVKAVATGSRPNPGDNKHVEFEGGGSSSRDRPS